MQKPRAVLDLSAPMLSLRMYAGLENPHAAAGARGVSYATQCKAEQQGPETKLATLMKAADKFGYEIEITATQKKARPGEERSGSQSMITRTQRSPHR